MGVAMGLWNHAERFLDIYILIGLTIPGLAWALLSVMWFGVSEAAPVFSIVMVVAPMLAVNAWQGTKAIDKQLLEMAKAFRISRRRVLAGVVITQLAPYLLAASRFGFGLGWKVVVLSEIFGLTNGIGYMLNRAFSQFSMTDVLAWTMGFTMIMFAFEYCFLQPLERHILRWRPKLSL
jgi:NitT/TauT family transport system permease protein